MKLFTLFLKKEVGTIITMVFHSRRIGLFLSPLDYRLVILVILFSIVINVSSIVFLLLSFEKQEESFVRSRVVTCQEIFKYSFRISLLFLIYLRENFNIRC